MKKIIFTLSFLSFTCLVSAQNYFGYLSDNYAGLQSVTLNPANITGSKFKSEVNLVSVSGSFNNDYVSGDFKDFLDGKDINNSNLNPTGNNNFAVNIDVMGPSFMFNLSEKHSIGIVTRARTFFSINEIQGELFDAFEDDFESENDYNLAEGQFTSTLHGWTEIGLVYGRTLIDKETHYLKGGFTLKYLQGLGNAYTSAKGLSVGYDADGAGPTVGTITTTGTIEYGSSKNLSENGGDFDLDIGSTGFGADLGFIYEWRPKNTDLVASSRANYRLKVGLSITDIGSINYKDAEANAYDITNTIDEITYNSQEDFEDKLNNLYTKIGAEDFTTVHLPTAMHVTVDYNLNSQFFVNFRTDLSLRKKNEVNTSKIDNSFILTPRFERKWFSAYIPLSVTDYSGFNAGFGFRAGPLFLGSNTILTNLMSSNSKAASVYAGLKIPIYKKGKSYYKKEQ